MAELESQLKVNRIEIANRERAMEELKQSIADYQARLNREPVREQQLADLTRDYDQSWANYESLLKRETNQNWPVAWNGGTGQIGQLLFAHRLAIQSTW